ncbi:transporter substrate-binding domain-containing protein [Galbitalea sp. SE-J8]|uniref:ABC transporter substrate-binding protein n=1 Tax=Galbitalea sp. SE-J8 TaxID=3054952 RepID=UPI00259D124E|nr:transporter substrate-binding domain-containing protein [Galbitalea sp. SE-J8]MDM4764152.1 transporter substrate-binding domain-containing protein [Galbitalea sp. SE-J8]
MSRTGTVRSRGIRSRVARSIATVAALAALTSLAACAPADDAAPGSTSSASDAATTPSADDYVTPGKLTIATGDPAYFPYVIDDDPTTGDGFEAAVAYAVADRLGFGKGDVEWVRTGFEEAIAPGPKSFDINLQQFTITDDRKKNVDFSSPYYATPQAVVTVEGTKAADATSIADLKGVLLGAATGTTSLTAIESVIAPDQQPQVFNDNDDAVLALKNGTVDAIVVDLPTAFYLTGVELDGGKLVGQLPAADGVSDEWGFVLDKDSPLTASVTAAVDSLRADGTLDAIADQWLGADAGAPVLQ